MSTNIQFPHRLTVDFSRIEGTALVSWFEHGHPHLHRERTVPLDTVGRLVQDIAERGVGTGDPLPSPGQDNSYFERS